jgi:hypothetical protein
MTDLASPRVREAIISSRDQSAAVNMMLQTGWAWDPGRVLADGRLAVDGRVSPILLWEKHGFLLAGMAVLALMLLLILKRLLFGTRPRIVVQHVADRGGR